MLYPCSVSYSDFFAADLQELRRAFVGWRLPAPNPKKRERVDPFTGASSEAHVWVPDSEDREEVEPFSGATLGKRLAHFPHVQLKGLDPLMLSELFDIVLGGGSTEWLSRIGNPPPLVNVNDSATEHHLFWELPASFVDAIAKYEPEKWTRVGVQWATCPNRLVIQRLRPSRPRSFFPRNHRAGGWKRLYYWVRASTQGRCVEFRPIAGDQSSKSLPVLREPLKEILTKGFGTHSPLTAGLTPVAPSLRPWLRPKTLCRCSWRLHRSAEAFPALPCKAKVWPASLSAMPR